MIQKFYLLCFAIAFSSMAFGQYTDDSVANNRIVFLLNKFKSTLLSSEEASEIKSLAYKIQNKGFFLGENNQDVAGALKEINNVLDIWIALRDTSNQANLYKKMNQQKMADKYSRLYEAEVASLKSRNIDAKPGYLTF